MDATSTDQGGQVESAQILPSKLTPQMGGEPQGETCSARSILIHEVKSVPNRLAHGEIGDFSVRLERLAAHVDHNQEFAGWLADRDLKRSEKLQSCGTWLMFREFFNVPRKPKRLAGGIFCQQALLCGFCAAGRATRHVMALNARIEHVMELEAGLVPYMVTLTAKGESDLGAMQRRVWGAWQKLMQRRRNTLKGKSDSITGTWRGGYAAGEAKRSKNGEDWHFHLHGIVLGPKGRYKPMWERLTREWAQLLGQKHASVQFQPIRMGLGSSLMSAILETSKYAVKWDHKRPEDRWEAFQALTRVRSLRTFGVLYGVKLPNEVTDDMSQFEGEEFREVIFKYFDGSYQERESLEAQREPAFDEFEVPFEDAFDV